MRSKNKTAAEKKWHETVCRYCEESGWLVDKFGGYVNSPLEYHLDHIIGAQAKRKINYVSEKVGEWCVICLPIELHCVSNNSNGFHISKPEAFISAFGTRIELFSDLAKSMVESGIEIPFDVQLLEVL